MSATSIRTLIVDDEPLARRGIRARLTAADIETIGECDGGRTAIDAINTLAPDLVFLDVQMPEVDGFAVIEPGSYLDFANAVPLSLTESESRIRRAIRLR